MEYFTRDTLIQRIKSPDSQESWDDFVAIYTPYLKAVIRNIGINEAEIDDLLQTVFVTCWEKLAEFTYDTGRGKFRHWLCRIAILTCKNHKRKFARRSELLSEHMEMDNSAVSPELEKLADEEWKLFISHKAWENVKQTLSGNMLSAYEKFLAGEDMREIAAQLGVEYNTVEVYKSRIEKKILSEMKRLRIELD